MTILATLFTRFVILSITLMPEVQHSSDQREGLNCYTIDYRKEAKARARRRDGEEWGEQKMSRISDMGCSQSVVRRLGESGQRTYPAKTFPERCYGSDV